MSAPFSERQAVAGLLIAAVAEIVLVHMDGHTRQGAGNRHGVVAAAVVDKDDLINDSLIHNLLVGGLERPRRVVGGHYNDDSFGCDT